MSSTTRRIESMASALAINSRLSAASPARFSSCVSTPVSNDCKREVNAAPRSQYLLRTDQPEGRILREPLGVVHILVPRQAAVDRLPHQVGQRQLGVLAPARIVQVPLHERAQTQVLVQLAHQNQATIRGHR